MFNIFGYRLMFEIYVNVDNFVFYIKEWVWFIFKNFFEKKFFGFWILFYLRLSEIKLIVFNVLDIKYFIDFFFFCNLILLIW